ncbi:MAG TPA: hypothetical protein VLB44_23780, partial [Kofleriaceae bacterium]|nr:hypothetical protein [Kofleriaceae bacterium]
QGANLAHTTFDGSTFQIPTPITELNTAAAQGFPSISGDGLDLYFETLRGDGAFDDVWVAHRDTIGGTFANAVRVDVSIAGANDADPEIARDGRTIVWASDRPGSLGVHDIYLATRSCL